TPRFPYTTLFRSPFTLLLRKSSGAMILSEETPRKLEPPIPPLARHARRTTGDGHADGFVRTTGNAADAGRGTRCGDSRRAHGRRRRRHVPAQGAQRAVRRYVRGRSDAL